MNTPLVSVILPVYNAEEFIAYSIRSILNQTFSDFELILINDGSSDQSEQIILSFQDERIRYYKNNSNLKLIETLNRGLAFAKGKYIARIDADDVCYLDRFEKQVVFLENNLEYGIVGSFAETFGNKQEVLKYVEEDEDIRYALITHNPYIHSTVMIRTSVLKDYHLKYKADQLHVEDYDLWIRMMKYSKGKILPVVLLKYRIHGNQISNLNSDIQNKNTINIQLKYINNLGFDLEESFFLHSILFFKQLPFDLLIKNLNYINLLVEKLPFKSHKFQFLNLMKKRIKDQILNQVENEDIDFIRLLILFPKLSFKQFLILIFKFLKYKRC